jgi:hypothetical protein
MYSNPPSPDRCREKDTSGKMDKKQLGSSARQHTCISVTSDKKVPCQAQCEGFGASAIFPGLTLPNTLLFQRLKNVLKGQQFASTEEVAAKPKRY